VGKIFTSKNGPWVLRINIIEGRNLLPREHAPYVMCTIAKEERKTAYIKRTSLPRWDETFDLPFQHSVDNLKLTVWDHKTLKSDKPIGRPTRLLLAELMENQTEDKWIAIEGTEGELHVRLTAYTKDQYPGKKTVLEPFSWFASKVKDAVEPSSSDSSSEPQTSSAVKTEHAEIDPVMEFYLKYTKRDTSGKMIVHDLPEDLAMLFKEAKVTPEELKDPGTIAPLIKLMHEALANPEMLAGSSEPEGAAAPLCKAKAVYAYAKQRDTDLELEVGEVISVFVKNDNGWWEGEGKHGRGDFPGNYVVEIEQEETPSLPDRTGTMQKPYLKKMELPQDLGEAPKPPVGEVESATTDQSQSPVPAKKAPPPPPAPAPKLATATTGGTGLQAELAGAKLKHTESIPKTEPTSGRGGLLAEIKGGAQLKHVDVQKKNLSELNSSERTNLTSILARAMEARRIDLRESHAATATEGDDDDEWD